MDAKAKSTTVKSWVLQAQKLNLLLPEPLEDWLVSNFDKYARFHKNEDELSYASALNPSSTLRSLFSWLCRFARNVESRISPNDTTQLNYIRDVRRVNALIRVLAANGFCWNRNQLGPYRTPLEGAIVGRVQPKIVARAIINMHQTSECLQKCSSCGQPIHILDTRALQNTSIRSALDNFVLIAADKKQFEDVLSLFSTERLYESFELSDLKIISSSCGNIFHELSFWLCAYPDYFNWRFVQRFLDRFSTDDPAWILAENSNGENTIQYFLRLQKQFKRNVIKNRFYEQEYLRQLNQVQRTLHSIQETLKQHLTSILLTPLVSIVSEYALSTYRISDPRKKLSTNGNTLQCIDILHNDPCASRRNELNQGDRRDRTGRVFDGVTGRGFNGKIARGGLL
jgi:hypothetical protein